MARIVKNWNGVEWRNIIGINYFIPGNLFSGGE